jgi:hypothetical protein
VLQYPKANPQDRREAHHQKERGRDGCVEGEKKDAVAAADADTGRECVTSRDDSDEDYHEELMKLHEGWMRMIQAIDTSRCIIIHTPDPVEGEDGDEDKVVQAEPMTN